MRKLYANLTREEADTYGLVLSASGLTCFQVKKEQAGWSLWVTAAAYESARQNIEKYCNENSGLTPPTESESPNNQKTFTAVWVSLVLLASFLAIGSDETFRSIADLCGASAREILKGEVYRSATALMLHATPAHLAGNIAGLVLFGTAVCYITGPGVGWLMILLTGIIGNIANAVLFGSDHLSVGASTAVFGAVGILSAYQFHQKMRNPDKRIKAWLPLAGGLALLGFLGAGPHTDLTAHLFGFIAGALTGLGYAKYMKYTVSGKYQAFCLAVSICLLAGSWYWAFLA